MVDDVTSVTGTPYTGSTTSDPSRVPGQQLSYKEVDSGKVKDALKTLNPERFDDYLANKATIGLTSVAQTGPEFSTIDDIRAKSVYPENHVVLP